MYTISFLQKEPVLSTNTTEGDMVAAQQQIVQTPAWAIIAFFLVPILCFVIFELYFMTRILILHIKISNAIRKLTNAIRDEEKREKLHSTLNEIEHRLARVEHEKLPPTFTYKLREYFSTIMEVCWIHPDTAERHVNEKILTIQETIGTHVCEYASFVFRRTYVFYKDEFDIPQGISEDTLALCRAKGWNDLALQHERIVLCCRKALYNAAPES